VAFRRAWLANRQLRDEEPREAQPASGDQCRYVAIIMDGNGRWAQRRHLPVAAGHRAGAKALRRVLEHAVTKGVEEVTVYSFSTENWTRPASEVGALMDLFTEMIETQVPDLH
jgi:undecaprenyl diphosphate synthase